MSESNERYLIPKEPQAENERRFIALRRSQNITAKCSGIRTFARSRPSLKDGKRRRAASVHEAFRVRGHPGNPCRNSPQHSKGSARQKRSRAHPARLRWWACCRRVRGCEQASCGSLLCYLFSWLDCSWVRRFVARGRQGTNAASAPLD